MALKEYGVFTAGMVTGWMARSVFGGTRELVVQAIVLGHDVRDRAKQAVTERYESAEDMIAEGRARYEALRSSLRRDDVAPQPNAKRDRGEAA
jgi:hypothetical protein